MLSDDGWQPIETAPKDGTPVDLWITGTDSTVDFYCANASKVKGQPVRHGRATDYQWKHRPPNTPYWYPTGRLMGFPLSLEVTPTHWRPIPKAPACAEECK